MRSATEGIKRMKTIGELRLTKKWLWGEGTKKWSSRRLESTKKDDSKRKKEETGRERES